MNWKEMIRMSIVGVVTFVVAWLVYGFVLSAAILLLTTHLVDLSHAEFLPALVPLLSISLAVLTAAGLMVKFRHKTKGSGQHAVEE